MAIVSKAAIIRSAPPGADEAVRKRTRSPAYPFINLRVALKRAEEFYDQETRGAASVKVAVKHWNYEEKSSGGLQTAAALISFGLMKDEGTGAKRKLQLTPSAIRILLDQRPDSAERVSLVKQAALTPKIHHDLWEKWGALLPSEPQFRYTLTAEWEPPFNENSVDGFIREYKDTIAFAGLSESDKLSEDSDKGIPEDHGFVPKVGDYVQWESNGILRMKEPGKVARISTDGAFAFIEGSPTGVPIGELIRADAPVGSTAVLQPQIARASVLPITNMQEDVYSIPEGRIVVQWPTSLSPESVEDIKAYLKLLEGKIKRSVTKEKPE